MSIPECIFCKIIAGDISVNKIAENDSVVVIEDINPKAPIHYLVIPKIHITNMCELQDRHERLCWEIMKMGRDLCLEKTGGSGFNFISNNGKDAGQSVFHMHWHFLSGRSLSDVAREGL